MTTSVVLIKLKLNLSFFVFSPIAFFFYCSRNLLGRRSRNLLGHRKDASKEGDETIVNHFHGVPSSSETHRDVCGQTDTLTDMVSIMVNKHSYKSSLQDVMDKYYEMFRGKNHPNKTDFFNRTEDSGEEE
jgi:hypothetical protein